MSDEMRQELNGVKAAVTSLTSTIDELRAAIRGTAAVVVRHEESLARIEKRLVKLDAVDEIKKSLEVFTAEILASRSDRTLLGKSFSDQQVTLTDHELRLTRLELRAKQS